MEEERAKVDRGSWLARQGGVSAMMAADERADGQAACVVD